jgi:hypothetical protein
VPKWRVERRGEVVEAGMESSEQSAGLRVPKWRVERRGEAIEVGLNE